MAGKRAVLFANGERANLPVLRDLLRPDDLLIAADAGLRFIYALGLQPALVVGDLDSLSPVEIQFLEQQRANLLRFPIHKDETDLELAVLSALDAGADSIWIVAALGGRLDMTLANIFLLMLPALEGHDVRLEDGYDAVFLIRPGSAPTTISGQPGDLVSLLPLQGPARGILTTGLQYPLDRETLWPERTRGISNRLLESSATVALEAGLLLCIHSHHALPGADAID